METKKTTEREKGTAKRTHGSLADRVTHISLLGFVAMSVVALGLGLTLYTRVFIGQFSTTASGLSRTVANSILHGTDFAPVVEEVTGIYHGLSPEERMLTGTEEYRARFAHILEDATYDQILGILHSVLDNSGLSDIYLAMYDRENCALVYIVDPNRDEAAMYPGDWDAADRGEMEKFLNWNGTGMLYDMGMTAKYGWMCTAGVPLKDENGEVKAFVMADVTMEEVAAGMKNFVLQFTFAMLLVTVLAASVNTRMLRRTVADPVNAIAEAAASYVTDKRRGLTSPAGHFRSLHIHTGDEIENLAQVMAGMEGEISAYEEDLARTVAEKERISTELNVATQIQANMLPHITPDYPGREEFALFASMTPAKEVGGDFYDFFLPDPDHLALVIADVSGKGVPAALFMVIAKTLLANRAQSGGTPSEILADINNKLCEGNNSSVFVTVWLGIFTISTGELVSSSAGHEYPALRCGGEEFALFHDPRGLPLGIMKDMKYEEARFKLEHGDTLFLYTDGVTEASDREGAFFGRERLLETLNRHAREMPDQILPAVRREIEDFACGAPRSDDITMLCLRFH